MLGLAWAVISANPLHAGPISVTDQKGPRHRDRAGFRGGDSVTFRRAGDAKEFTLPISNFAADSQESIRKEARRIPAAMPKIQPDVIIGKRRKKGDSYYMVTQEINATVKLTNPSLHHPGAGGQREARVHRAGPAHARATEHSFLPERGGCDQAQGRPSPRSWSLF